MSKVSVNLVTRDGLKFLPYCWQSLKEQNFTDFEIIIIDNCSQDDSVSFFDNNIAEWPGKKITFVKNKDNAGFAKAHNQAMGMSQGKYVLVLNQDVVLEKSFLANIVDFMDKNPDVAASTGKLWRWDFDVNKVKMGIKDEKDFYLTISEKTSKIDTIGLEIFQNHRFTEMAGGEDEKTGNLNENMEVFGVSGAAPVYRRKALENVKIGQEYFDEDFFSYKEDTDLAYRLRLAGFKAYFVANACGYHQRSASSGKNNQDADIAANRKNKSVFANYYSYRNHLLLLVKNLTPKTFFWYFPYIAWYEFKKIIYLLFFERETLKSLKDFFRLLPKALAKRKIIMSGRKVKDKEIWKWLE